MTQRRLVIGTCTILVLFLSYGLGQPPAVKPLPEKRVAERIDGPPIVTAKAWAIADGKTGNFLWGDHEGDVRQMASTTKIMTACLVLSQVKEKPELFEEKVTVSERAGKIGGSSARVQVGEKYKVRDLLYGLLLPSGNDAAVALAEHFGSRFQSGDAKEDPLDVFVAKMNAEAKRLGMQKTNYLDPHGNSKNETSARDLTVLAWHAMQNSVFRKYVQTRRFECKVTNPEGEARTAVWTNTNRLLGIDGYDGVKTGTTSGAGRCLVASGRHKGDHLIVVVLGCTSQDSRYTDPRNLFRWAWRKRVSKD